MRLMMTEAGQEAWFAALTRNVRLQLTRFEIGESDVYTLSGHKQGGKTVQQFRALDYEPSWVPDINTLLGTDTVVYEGDLTDVGYWRVRNNDGGLIFRIPVDEDDMTIGNIRIYAKNTGPYPYAKVGQGVGPNLMADTLFGDTTKWEVYRTDTSAYVNFDAYSWHKELDADIAMDGVASAAVLDSAHTDWTSSKTHSQKLFAQDTNNLIPVTVGREYTIAATVRNNSNHALVYTLEWWNGGVFHSNLGSTVVAPALSGSPRTLRIRKNVIPPAGVTHARLVVYNGNGGAGNAAFSGDIIVTRIEMFTNLASYKQYQEIYDDDHGGEVLLFAGFASVADRHWKSETTIPHFAEIRLAIHADGLFNIIDRADLAFEADIDVLEVETEDELLEPTAQAYGCAVVRHHKATDKVAVCYRTMGAKGWFGYPLHEHFQAPRETPIPIADSNIDGGTLDNGTLTPTPIVLDDVQQGVVISGQPRQMALANLAFTQNNVSSYTMQTAPSTVNIQPNTLQQYTAVFKVADLAFLGSDQQLYLIHNTTRYRLLTKNKKRNTPPIILQHGDTIKLEGTLQGPISSLTGYVYAELNEAPLTNDSDNKPVWMVGKISMHVTSSVPCKPDNLNFGLVGRRISGYTWNEKTPEQRISGLGYDMYGIPQQPTVTIRVVPSEGKVGGTGYMSSGQQAGGAPSYLSPNYIGPDGKPVYRRGVYGIGNTRLRVLKNDVVVGTIATTQLPEGGVSFTIQDTDRISFQVELEGQPYNPSLQQDQVLPAIAVAVEGITSQGKKWLEAEFDLAATFGPDTVAPTTGTLSAGTPPTALTNVVGFNSFSDMENAYLINQSVVVTPSLGSPHTMYGDWLTLMAAPNPTINCTTSLTILGLVVTGTVTNGYLIELEKFGPWAGVILYELADQGGLTTPINLGTVAPADSYRIRATFLDPNVRVQLIVRVTTDVSVKDLLVDCEVKNS